jgi:hypothetical protein
LDIAAPVTFTRKHARARPSTTFQLLDFFPGHLAVASGSRNHHYGEIRRGLADPTDGHLATGVNGASKLTNRLLRLATQGHLPPTTSPTSPDQATNSPLSNSPTTPPPDRSNGSHPKTDLDDLCTRIERHEQDDMASTP